MKVDSTRLESVGRDLKVLHEIRRYAAAHGVDDRFDPHKHAIPTVSHDDSWIKGMIPTGKGEVL